MRSSVELQVLSKRISGSLGILLHFCLFIFGNKKKLNSEFNFQTENGSKIISAALCINKLQLIYTKVLT